VIKEADMSAADARRPIETGVAEVPRSRWPEGDDFGSVDEAVDYAGGHDVVADDFAPSAEAFVEVTIRGPVRTR
jgi:hypothetical protein